MTTSGSENPPSPRPRRKRRWLLPAFLVIALFGAMAAWMVHITARRTIVGKTDPTTGLHCVFTVAQGWSSVERLALSDRPDIMDDYHIFDLPKPTPLQTWLDTNIFHRTSFSKPFGLPGSLFVSSATGKTFPGYELRDGYPTINPSEYAGTVPKFTQLEEKHLLLSGQPTLWAISRLDFPANFIPPGSASNTPGTLYEYIFVVKVRDQPLWYAVAGITDEAHSRQVRNEVRAIGESLRIEKAKGK